MPRKGKLPLHCGISLSLLFDLRQKYLLGELKTATCKEMRSLYKAFQQMIYQRFENSAVVLPPTFYSACRAKLSEVSSDCMKNAVSFRKCVWVFRISIWCTWLSLMWWWANFAEVTVSMFSYSAICNSTSGAMIFLLARKSFPWKFLITFQKFS